MSSTLERIAQSDPSGRVEQGLVKSRVCAVVVTHHPDPGVPSRVERIARQVDAVLIVDNHSSDAERDMLRGMAAGSGAIELWANPANRGVAAALNQGIAWARARGYAWALTVDQDTTPMDGLVAGLAAVYEDARAGKRIAVVGANYADGDDRGVEYRRRAGAERGRPWIEAATVLTAGSALSLAAFEEIGPFREALFIDHVDHEYCLRARARGFSVIRTREVLVTHRIGAVSEHRWLGRTSRVENHPARRWYFKSRNLTVVAREYGRREPRWTLGALAWHVRTAVLMTAFEEERMRKWGAIGRGIRDGLRGRLGGYRGEPIPEARAST